MVNRYSTGELPVKNTNGIIIDAGGGFDATVIQTGLDLVGNDFTAFIKAGTYAAGFTEASSGVRIFIEPGTIIQAAITMSGADSTLIIGAGTDIQGLVTMSGVNGKFYCMNGVDTDGVLLSGDKCLHDGGGWDTLHNGGTANDGIQVTGVDCIIRNCAAQSTAGGANNLDGVSMEGARGSVVVVKVVDSDDRAIAVLATDILVKDCTILGADDIGIYVAEERTRVIGNYVIATGGIGISFLPTGDNSVAVGNIVQDPGGDSIDIHSNSENCVVVGNRTDGAIDDNSGTSTVGGNDETAF
jgi:hypothetical protein